MNNLNNIPKHWQIKKLEDFLDYIQPTKYIVRSTDYSENFEIPVLTAGKSFMLGKTNERDNVFTDLPVIIFDDFTTANKFVNFPFKVKSSAMKILKPKNEKINLHFVNYYMKTLSVSIDTHKRYWISVFSKLPIPTPPLEEQQLIVSRIEELFSELENGKKQLQTALQQLKVYRQSLLKWAFEGKLTNKNVKDGELPEGWKWVAIKDVIIMNPKIPSRENISNQMEIQFIPMKLVEETINKIHLTEIRKYGEVLKGSYTQFINGDVIFAKVTPCMENGKIAIVDNLKNGIGFGSSEFHVLRSGKSINNLFVFYFLVQDSFRREAASKMSGAVGLRRVPKQFVENFLIPLPPIKEQRLIVSELESKLTVCAKIEQTINESLHQAETLKQSILKMAFEGRLVKYSQVSEYINSIELKMVAEPEPKY